jgi:hypothetical protein
MPAVSSPFHRSLRLPGYDYCQDGAYFVIVCTNHRISLFGSIHAGLFTPNEAGTEIEGVWRTLPVRFPEDGFSSTVGYGRRAFTSM